MADTKGHGRGFASMSPEKKREIASKGGKIFTKKYRNKNKITVKKKKKKKKKKK